MKLAFLAAFFLLGSWVLAESNFPYLGTDTAKANLPLDQILSAGPPPQGVPALGFSGNSTGQIPPTAAPRFIPVGEARWLSPEEPVIVYGGRAYPLQVLLWHEIVNQSLEEPVAVTFCPLSDSALVFDRRVPLSNAQREAVLKLNPKAKIAPLDAGFRAAYKLQTGQEAPPWGLEVTFGTSGMLYNSNTLMFDSATGSIFPQISGEGGVGTLAGARLLRYPAQVVSFAEFVRAYPGGLVLSRETGFTRPYEQNPYLGYDRMDTPPFLDLGARDNRLPPKERVVALELIAEPVVYPFSTLAEKRVINDTVGGIELVVWWTPETRSALDASPIAKSRDIGAVGVFKRSLEGRTLNFVWDGRGWVDQESGSRWNLLGQAVEGPLKGKRLAAVPYENALWFAWSAFRPNTQIRR